METSKRSSYDARYCGTVVMGETIEIGILNVHEAFSPGKVLEGEAAHYAKLGLDYLARADYVLAGYAFEKSLERALGEPELHYYAALAQLAGRRPKRLKKPEARSIEGRLEQAIRGASSAHAHLLYAFFKQDFYVLNGLRLHPPTPDDLLRGVASSGIPASRWQELRRHAPIEAFAREASIRP
jgi:hypothetical protein